MLDSFGLRTLPVPPGRARQSAVFQGDLGFTTSAAVTSTSGK